MTQFCWSGPASGGSIPCEVADQQIGKIVEAIELGPRWEEEVLSIVSSRDEAESIREKRQKVQERLRRLGKVYLEGVLDDGEYDRQKRVCECWQSAQVGQIRTREDYYYEELRGSSLMVLL